LRPGYLTSTAAFIAMLALVGDALAQAPQPAAGPAREQVETAREAYARGQALFAEGKYAEAKGAFEQAYAAVPNPIVLLPIAECELRLGNIEAAHDAFQHYLSVRPDAPDRAEVEAKIAEIAAMPATLVLTSDPPGAAISVDGQSTGKVTPAEVTVTRGDHRVDFTLDGFDAASASVTARMAARHELHASLEPLPAPPPETVAPGVQKAAVQTASPETALWISGIVGAAGIVTGTVLGIMVLAERSDFDANPTAESADRGERLALFTDVAFGVGVMALLTGAVIYFTASSEDPPEAGAGLQLTPMASTRSAGFVARTRF
jgi:tetratricopeptide (TPR) repeat protein